MRDLGFLTGHVTFKLLYNQIYQLKTTLNIISLHSSNRNEMMSSDKMLEEQIECPDISMKTSA